MHSTISTFVRRAVKTTAAVACLGAWLAHGQTAKGQTLYLDDYGSDFDYRHSAPTDGDDRLTTGDPQRSPLPTVAMNGDTLVISGVAGAHTVYIIGVEGKPGAMTVHFDNWAMQLFFNVTHIDVDLVGGANFLGLFQVHVEGNVTVSAGDGDNLFLLGLPAYDPNLIWGDLTVFAGHGANEVRIEESWVIGNATVDVGDGGNTVVLGRSDSPSDLGAVLGGDLFIATGAGHDLVEIAKSWFEGQATIDTGDGDDTVILGTHYESGSAIAGNVFAGDLAVSTGHGSDSVGLTDNEVYGDASIQTWHDSDELLLGAGAAFPPNSFFGQFSAHGGNGQDTLENDPANFYAIPPQILSFELP